MHEITTSFFPLLQQKEDPKLCWTMQSHDHDIDAPPAPNVSQVIRKGVGNVSIDRCIGSLILAKLIFELYIVNTNLR